MTYFVPKHPTSGEHGTYNRHPNCFLWTTNNVRWVWQFGSGVSYTSWPKARMRVDGVPVTDWITPEKNEYVFEFDCEDGHHIAVPEVSGAPVLAKPFVVNTTGVPLPEQKPWTATNRFEMKYVHGNFSAQVPYTPGPPVTYPLKAREIEPYSERLATKDLWAIVDQMNIGARLMRMFTRLPTGDIAVEAAQKYFYADATTHGQTNPVVEPPPYHLIDGPRGIGTVGPLYKIIVRRGCQGIYAMDTTGRLIYKKDDGEVITEAGWRVKPGEMPYHAGILSNHYPGNATPAGKAEHRALYNSAWELYGDWSRVRGPSGFLEPWGFCIAQRRSDDTLDKRDGHEFWICDTLHHRILFVNHWTAHEPENYEPAHYPPLGYESPAGPTGTSQIVTWLDTPDGQPNELLDEPWDCEIGPDGKLYWTNYGNGTICRANLDGTNPEVVLRTAVNPTDGALGFARRLDFIKPAKVESARQVFLRDGPNGEATCVRPQGMGFASDGKLIFAERYTYAIRELDVETRTVRTLALIPKILAGSDSASTSDIAISIDVEGTCGPRDDIFINGWHGCDYRFSRQGEVIGRIAWTSGAQAHNGRLDTVKIPGYAWGIGVGDGRIYMSGNASGFQDIMIVKKLPSDPVPNVALWKRGEEAYRQSPMALTHGSAGVARIGMPSFELLGAMDDAALDAYLTTQGVTDLEGVRHYIRTCTCDLDYSAAPIPDPEPEQPEEPVDPLAAALARIEQLEDQIGEMQDEDAQNETIIAGLSEEIAALEAKIATAREVLA